MIAAMARALADWHAEAASRQSVLASLRGQLEQGLVSRCEPAFVNAAEANRLPNTSNIAFPGMDGEALLVALDLAGIACSLGSTCASGSTEPAPSLVAMGLPRDRLHSSVRFSVGIDNTADEIRLAIDKIAGVVQRLRSQSA